MNIIYSVSELPIVTNSYQLVQEFVYIIQGVRLEVLLPLPIELHYSQLSASKHCGQGLKGDDVRKSCGKPNKKPPSLKVCTRQWLVILGWFAIEFTTLVRDLGPNRISLVVEPPIFYILTICDL